MFRLLSRQAVKAVPRPGLLLSSGTASRRIHSIQAPYSGPPNYETIARRFSSSQVDPQVYFAQEREKEISKRGESTDIHDITPEEGIYPDEYDVLLSDITHDTLMQTISDEIGIAYLSEATDDTKKAVSVCDGYIYGPNRRPIVPLVVSYRKQSRWVFFIVDSESPWTFLSNQAFEALKIKVNDHDPHMAVIATIGGYPSPFRRSRPSSHYHDVNILGADFCYFHGVRVMHDYSTLRTKLHITEGGEVTEETKL